MYVSPQSIDQVSSGKLVTDASTIGIKPGTEWPKVIAVSEDGLEGFLFYKSSIDRSGTDLAGVRYLTKNGKLELLVVND